MCRRILCYVLRQLSIDNISIDMLAYIHDIVVFTGYFFFSFFYWVFSPPRVNIIVRMILFHYVKIVFLKGEKADPFGSQDPKGSKRIHRIQKDPKGSIGSKRIQKDPQDPKGSKRIHRIQKDLSEFITIRQYKIRIFITSSQ